MWQFVYSYTITSMIKNIDDNIYGITNEDNNFLFPSNSKLDEIIQTAYKSDKSVASFSIEDNDGYEIIYGIGEAANCFISGVSLEQKIVYCGSSSAKFAKELFPKNSLRILNKKVKIYLNNGVIELNDKSILILLPYDEIPDNIDKSQLLHNITGTKNTIDILIKSINQIVGGSFSIYNVNETIKAYFGGNAYFGLIYGVFFIIVSVFVLVEMCIEYVEKIKKNIKNNAIMYLLGKNKNIIIIENVFPDLLKVILAIIVTLILFKPLNLESEKWLGVFGVGLLCISLILFECIYILELFAKNRVVREIK